MIKHGQLYIVSAPSGAGKSSLIAGLLQGSMKENIQVSISHTTRAMRPGEEDAKHYFFIDNTVFEEMIEKESFVEYAKVFDHYYGTSYAAIKDYLEQGIDVFLDIDWQGARQVREKFSTARSIFILPPSKAALKERLVNRGQDKPEVIEKRMAKAIAEMSHFDEYDYLVINDDFNRAVEDIQAILQAERLRRSRQVQCYQQLIDNLLAE